MLHVVPVIAEYLVVDEIKTPVETPVVACYWLAEHLYLSRVRADLIALQVKDMNGSLSATCQTMLK